MYVSQGKSLIKGQKKKRTIVMQKAKEYENPTA